MSYTLEGVLCIAPFENIRDIDLQISSSLNLQVDKIDDCLSCIYRVENQRNWIFDSEMEYVASQISVILSKAILIRYDDRVGYRESTVFQEGYPIKSFNLNDEIWVMLDEDGQPIIDGKQFTIEQIADDDDDEYETIYNAIQLGLDLLGIHKIVWKDVHSFITKP